MVWGRFMCIMAELRLFFWWVVLLDVDSWVNIFILLSVDNGWVGIGLLVLFSVIISGSVLVWCFFMVIGIGGLFGIWVMMNMLVLLCRCVCVVNCGLSMILMVRLGCVVLVLVGLVGSLVLVWVMVICLCNVVVVFGFRCGSSVF